MADQHSNRPTAQRILAGIFAGGTAGLLLAVPFTAIFLEDATFFGTPLDAGIIWFVHLAVSATVGAIFGLAVPPRSYTVAIGVGVVGLLLVYLIGQPILSSLGILPRAFAVSGLLAHLVFGVVLGVVYVAFHRLEQSYRRHTRAMRA